MVLKLSLRILLRTLDKMKIEELNCTSSPVPSKKISVIFSSGKRKRQDELLGELEDERRRNNRLKLRLKEKELEIQEISSAKHMNATSPEGSELKLYTRIQTLEEALLKNREDFDMKNRKILELSVEISKLNDQVDILQEENRTLCVSVAKFKESKEKFKQIGKLEKEIQDLGKRLTESYNDKDSLLLEIQSLRVNSRIVELLEKQISSVNEERFSIKQEYNYLKVQYDRLQESYEAQSQIVAQIPPLKEEISFLKQLNGTPSISQRTSLTSQPQNLLVEELEVKIKEINEENKNLCLSLQEKDTALSLINSLKELATNSECTSLQYSRLECKYYSEKLDYNEKIKGLSEQLDQKEKELTQIKNDNDALKNENGENTLRIQGIERQYQECIKSLESLRSENFRLRETNTKLKSTIESDKLKNENFNLKREIIKLKSDLAESSQINYALKAENSHLYDIIEESKKESINMPVPQNQLDTETSITLLDIVKHI